MRRAEGSKGGIGRQHFNGSGSESARCFAVTSAAGHHNTDFVFDNPFAFDDRFSSPRLPATRAPVLADVTVKITARMIDDKNLSPTDVQALAARNGVVAFFASLGYRTDTRLPQSVAAMGITAESLKRQIEHVERIAVHEDGAEPLDVYLVELTSVTVAATHGLARALRNRAGNYLLVLTDDYERIDFVLLQRSLPAASTSGMSTKQVAVRPRILTVNRRNPSLVQMRVLRRFTYTEEDSDAQYEKLLSAYTVAEWSEPMFNNRALFSDYYLNERLREHSQWNERPEQVYHRLRDLLTNARRQDLGGGDPAFLEKALEALGFRSIAATASGSGEDPDYWLCASDGDDKPVAACLAYAWNRYLDGRDETRDTESPDENPGARVVSVLESEGVSWAIVTNGKLWRLYSAKTHSRSTNYYEVDLEETLAMADPNEAFRYFWLFFRLNAFVTKDVTCDGQDRNICFLDELLEESENYAKGLGERLKERVFQQVFPSLAEGFIEHLRGQGGLAGPQQTSLLPVAEQLSLKREPDEGFRRQVFQGTLTLLYRLLFLLYAESRGLLPAKEERGYFERSLTKLKHDIGGKAGDIVDDVTSRLSKAYGASADATGLYDRLLDLFSVIDRGSRDLNVPLYNGGLFVTTPVHALEATAAEFLASHKIPDRYLAHGLDLLARDVDQKRQDLVFIDYKSLGVRQLGSIYEGLLEFRIRIAQEKMAVVKGRKTEEVIPYAEAKKSGRRILTRGRGRSTAERVYPPGAVYLENDRKERKASGSYYTPDHIVKYIVENTLGPVLTEKFENMRSEFRDTQKRHRAALNRDAAFAKKAMASNEALKVARSERSRKLADNLFDLRILDPAMGSGHFLVEAVDFICDRILGERQGFLRAFPWNPVTAFLDDTRQAIIAEMERQQVSVDTGRLTDVNLLKRHVLKRCVYGVDLNPMAVELAKVSLWLDCFTIGAPLSFLDHHLKCGNSLIGTTVADVQAELAPSEQQTMNLFGGPFQGLLTATATMEELRRIPDATVEQAERSQLLFDSFEEAQAPYKGALDIWVSQHFGNTHARRYLTLAGSELVTQIRSGGQGLPDSYRKAISQASDIRRAKRFFHWDLEFPEAFVDLTNGGWKAREEQGFHVVVGNPPYDEVSEWYSGNTRDEMSYLTSAPSFAGSKSGRLNLYRLFLLRAPMLTRDRGKVSFIVPMALLGDKFSLGTRTRLLRETRIDRVDVFPQKDDPLTRVFLEAKQSTCIILLSRPPKLRNTVAVQVHPRNYVMAQSRGYCALQDDLYSFTPSQHAVPLVSAREWNLLTTKMHPSLGSCLDAVATIYAGEICDNAQNRRFLSDDPIGPMILRGANLNRYELFRVPKQGSPRYLDVDAWHSSRKGIRRHHVKTPRLVFQKGAAVDNWRRLIATVIPAGEYCFDTIGYIPFNETANPYSVLALLNSKLWDFRFSATSTTNHINAYELEAILVPQSAVSGGSGEKLAEMAKLYLKFNRGKADEVEHFLHWLFSQLSIRDGSERKGIDALAGKTTIMNYAGDHQRRKQPTTFQELWKILEKNKGRFGRRLDAAFKAIVERAYRRSLSVLEPVVEGLAELDREIDEEVYKIYGLNDDEKYMVRHFDATL